MPPPWCRTGGERAGAGAGPQPRLLRQPCSAAELAAAFGVADEHTATYRTWLDWLAARDVLAADPIGYRLGTRFGQVAALSHWTRLTRSADPATAQRLAALAADLPAILRGEVLGGEVLGGEVLGGEGQPTREFADLLPDDDAVVNAETLRDWLAHRLPPALRPTGSPSNRLR